jgi:hypothetical protein
MASSATYDVYDTSGTLLHSAVCANLAAEVMGLYPEEIEWAVEEFGLCDTGKHVAVEEGDLFPS